jgi:hypothetical protein
MRVFVRLARWGLLATALACGIMADADGQFAEPTHFSVTAHLTGQRLRETSGVAVSRVHPGVLWTHNDSGDGPSVYATDLHGRDLGTYRLIGAGALDWEDIALGPCPAADGDCLYLADTGDNLERRPEASIYILEEPGTLAGGLDSLPARRLAVTYADGPQDVEALAVTRDGTILLISKGRRGGIKLYRIPRLAARGPSVTVQPSNELGIVPQPALARQVTGAAVSPDGTRLVLRTYAELFFYRVGSEGLVRLGRSCWLGAREPQGEAVDFLDDSTLVLTSESRLGRSGMIATVRCPPGAGRP